MLKDLSELHEIMINHDNKPEKILFRLKQFESKDKNKIKKSFNKEGKDFLQLTDKKRSQNNNQRKFCKDNKINLFMICC